MDNNVSKNTISQKFFELRFTKENNLISIKHSLRQELLQTLDLYRREANIELDLEFFDRVLERKITLFPSSLEKLGSKTQSRNFFSKLSITSIGYSCPIAFTLATYSSLTSQTIAESLLSLLTLDIDNTIYESNLKLAVEIVDPGWINFYLEPQAIAAWLKIQTEIESTLPEINLSRYKLEKALDNLFPVQYVHARCCNLLCLGEREKLITLRNGEFGDRNGLSHTLDSSYNGGNPAPVPICKALKDSQPITVSRGTTAGTSATDWLHNALTRDFAIQDPQTISWLDEEQNLWLTRDTEYSLLRQLLIVTDSFKDKSSNWLKLAFDLSKTVEVFLADCRFLGEVRRETPQLAIARLGLIALSQYWLQRILLEKLRVAAPVSL